MDVVVLAPNYPNGFLDMKHYLAAGVWAAFECKNTLRLEHVRRAIKTSTDLGRLERDERSPLRHEIVCGVLAHSHNVKSKLPENSVAEAISRADADLVKDPSDCLDLLCVADLGTWTLLRWTVQNGTHLRIDTSYMGPGRFKATAGGDGSSAYEVNPIGRMLTTLLRRLAPADPALNAMVDYFDLVGLGGIGAGTVRTWDAKEFPHLTDRTIW